MRTSLHCKYLARMARQGRRPPLAVELLNRLRVKLVARASARAVPQRNDFTALWRDLPTRSPHSSHARGLN